MCSPHPQRPFGVFSHHPWEGALTPDTLARPDILGPGRITWMTIHSHFKAVFSLCKPQQWGPFRQVGSGQVVGGGSAWLTQPVLIHSTPTSGDCRPARAAARSCRDEALVQGRGSHLCPHTKQVTADIEPDVVFKPHFLKECVCRSLQETSCCLHPAHQHADGIHCFIHSSNMHLRAYSVPGTVPVAENPAVAAVDKVTARVVLTV